jgi:hypothetical protein
MPYKKKLTILSGIIAALSLLYILTLIFAPERTGKRSDIYSWLEPSQVPLINGITITNAHAEDNIVLARNGGKWFVSHNGKDYPARQLRVEDFIATLTKKDSYPLRSSSASSHAQLSLTEETATRITLAGGAGLPILNLLIGAGDLTGQNVYMRKQGQHEVRSGENKFSAYTGSPASSWYNLRLFPESENGKIDTVNVQRLTVYVPSESGLTGGETPQIFSRKGKEWTFNFELLEPDMGKIDSYIRDILNTQGDDFVETVNASNPMFNYSRLVLELGDGSIRTIRFSQPDEDGKNYAAITGSDLVYSIPSWTMLRLFPEFQTFSKVTEDNE